MLYRAKEGKIQIGNLKMDYITFGRGERSLVLIQGLNTGGINGMALPLAYTYRMFAKEYTVYLFDRREDLPQEITVQVLAADIATVMDHLAIRQADVIGVSQGGMIAQYLAIDRPDLVHKLILAVTVAKNNMLMEHVIQHWISLTEQGDMKALVVDMAEKLYSEKYMKRYKPLLPLLTVVHKPKNVQRFITLAKACLTCDTYDLLERIHCPVLVLGGRQDKIVGGQASEELAEQLCCDIYMYEQFGHGVYEEAKDFNKRMYDFLRR